MSNRRRLKVKEPGEHEPRPTLPRFPHKDPAISTVRSWLRQLESAGIAERKGVEHTGKPGRPAVLWGLTDEAAKNSADAPPRPDLPTRDEARKLLHEASREELGVSGRQFVRQLDAGLWGCGWKCQCSTPHDPSLRTLIRIAAWSRMSVASVSRPEPATSSAS